MPAQKVKPPRKPTTGSVSVERLHHFRCGSCNKWWSIGDPSIAANVLEKEWFCPWCGKKQQVNKR